MENVSYNIYINFSYFLTIKKFFTISIFYRALLLPSSNLLIQGRKNTTLTFDMSLMFHPTTALVLARSCPENMRVVMRCPITYQQ